MLEKLGKGVQNIFSDIKKKLPFKRNVQFEKKYNKKRPLELGGYTKFRKYPPINKKVISEKREEKPVKPTVGLLKV